MIASLLLAAALSLGAKAPAEPLALTVMSFNVRYGTAPDGDNAWPKRRDILVETIKQQKPDVLGVQECLKPQAEYIEQELRGYRYLGVGREPDGGGEMSAIFYNERHLFPIATGSFWLSESPTVPGSKSWDSSLPRMVTWAAFFHPGSGKTINVANTHFDHIGRKAREESAKILAEFAAKNPDGPVIITGDFNSYAESSEPYKVLTNSGLQDAWLATPERTGPTTTWSAFAAPDPESKQRIDWVLFQGALKCTHAETVTFNVDGRYPSDHYPVVARFVAAE